MGGGLGRRNLNGGGRRHIAELSAAAAALGALSPAAPRAAAGRSRSASCPAAAAEGWGARHATPPCPRRSGERRD